MFYNTTTFGGLGTAFLPTFYRRVRYGGNAITEDIRAAFQSFAQLLEWAPPRKVPFAQGPKKCTLAYADAFFVCGDESFAPPTAANRDFKASQLSKNGWGLVVISREGAWCARGQLPEFVIQRLAEKKTLIFFLETAAQCIMNWIFAQELGEHYWSFVENEGSKFALTKGFSRDTDTNAIISLFWGHSAVTGTHPWFERVASEAQVADGVSRDDWSLPNACGWTCIELALDEIWRVVLRVLDDGGVASLSHIQDLAAAARRARDAAGLPCPTTAMG